MLQFLGWQNEQIRNPEKLDAIKKMFAARMGKRSEDEKMRNIKTIQHFALWNIGNRV